MRNKARLRSVTCLPNTSARNMFDHALTAPDSALFLVLTYFLFPFLVLWCLLSCYCNPAAKTSLCSAGEWKPLFQTSHALPLCFSAVVYAKAGGEKPGLEALEGRVCSFLQYTCKDRMLLCLAWVPLGNKTFSVKYLAQTSGGMLKTHPQYRDSNKKHSERSIYHIACWEHMMWKCIKLWKSIGLGSERQSCN